MGAVTLLLLTGNREALVVPDNVPRVAISSLCDDCWVVARNGKNVVFGMEEMASVFLELSREEATVPTDGAAIPAVRVVGMVFTEGNADSVGEEKDVGVILEDTSVTSEVMKAGEDSVLSEVGLGMASSVVVGMIVVVLGVVEDNNEENDPTGAEVSKETAEGDKAEPLTDTEDISDIGPEVAGEGLFKRSGSAVLEDLVTSVVGVSETLLEPKAVALSGCEDIW